MENFFKVVLFSLYRHEKNKKSTDSYALISSISTVSFMMLMNFHSIMLLGERLFPSLFITINKWIYDESYFAINTILLYALPFLWVKLKQKEYGNYLKFEQEMENNFLVKKYGSYNIVFYCFISVLIFFLILVTY